MEYYLLMRQERGDYEFLIVSNHFKYTHTHTNIHTYIHIHHTHITYTHTHTHTQTQTYIQTNSLTLGELVFRLTICGLLVRLFANDPLAGPGEIGDVGEPDTSFTLLLLLVLLLLTLGTEMRDADAGGCGDVDEGRR